MTTTLDSLPHEVLAHICSFDDLSLSSLFLWKCGSRSIRHKLSQGVSQISLANTGNFDFRLPKYLVELRALRSLSVNISSGYSSEISKSVVDVLLGLSPTLESLELQTRSAGSIYASFCNQSPFTPSPECHSYTNPPGDTSNRWFGRITIFPRLHTINLICPKNYSPVALKSLPLTLTRLQTPLPDGTGTVSGSIEQAKYLLSHLPPTLVHLTLTCEHEEESEVLEYLPPQLTFLKISDTYMLDSARHGNIAKMPRALTTMDMHAIEWSPELPAALPPGLRHLSYISYASNMSDDDLTSFPTTLEELQLEDFHITARGVRLLPRSLKLLHCSLKPSEEEITKDAWPPALTELLLSVGKEKFNLQIPANLRTLSLQSSDYVWDKPFANLAYSGITLLELNVRKLAVPLTLPPLLETLFLSASGNEEPRDLALMKSIFEGDVIPSSLESISLAGVFDRFYVPISALPLGLGHFIGEVSDFDPKLKDVESRKARARLLSEDAKKSGFNYPDLSNEDVITVLGLLPRRLRSIEFTSITPELIALGPEKWAQLPPLLSVLSLPEGTPTLSTEAIEHIPKKYMSPITLKALKQLQTVSAKVTLRNELMRC